MKKLDILAFDADDTLWHNLIHFDKAEDEFARMMSAYGDVAANKQFLSQLESRNVKNYGYGMKSFTLSMIEAAIGLSGGTVENAVISRLIELGRDMLDHDIELLPHVEETLRSLYGQYKLLLITKGDLFHQERKVLASGLAHFFEGVEIVTEKKADLYGKLATRHGSAPERMLMAGNSLKSDVMPMIRAGGYGVYVPFHITWGHEHEDVPPGTPRFHEVEDLRGVPAYVAALEGRRTPEN